MNYTLQEIAVALNTIAKGLESKQPLLEVVFDSRRISSPSSSVFFALPGEKKDGHEFILDCYQKGIRCFVVRTWIHFAECPEASYIEVENVLDALQTLALYHRLKFQMPVIGITGSNGKTVVKEWLSQISGNFFSVIRSPKSYNSQLGVALSLLNMQADHDLAIIEAGISKPGEMARLSKTILPTIGVLTNIGESHLEFFTDKNQLSKEKTELFSSCKIIIGKESEYLNAQIAAAINPNAVALLWSKDQKSRVFLKEVKISLQTTELEIVYETKAYHIIIPFTDEASIENTMSVFCCCIALNIEENAIPLFSTLSPINMRMHIIQGLNGSFVIDDSYSSDFFSLKIAFDFLARHRASKETLVILSDILQSPYKKEELYSRVAQTIKENSITKLIAIGPQFVEHQKLFDKNVEFFTSTEDYLKTIKPNDYSGKAILVKGARNFGFERVVVALQEQSHETVLEIDLGAVAHNLRHFRSKLQPSVKMMVMVKAAGYGSGAVEVSKVLEYNRVDYLAVAYSDEGIALRDAGILTPIMVMNPDQTGLNSMLKNRLEPEVYSLRSFQNLIHAMNAEDIHHIPAHIKLDTGMHRLGFEKKELPELLDFLRKNSRVKIGSIFTHLVASEDPLSDLFTNTQLDLFEEMSQKIADVLGYQPLLHASNTGGIERHPRAQYSMVRLGIGLYGISPSEEEQAKLRNVSTLKTKISQIKKIHPGESVGYNRRFIANVPTTVATIPIGYADGLKRSMSNGVGEVNVNGSLCPIIGNVCMDMTMINISNTTAEVGDQVVIFGISPTISEIASHAGTIPYEILTSISQRVKRVYVEE